MLLSPLLLSLGWQKLLLLPPRVPPLLPLWLPLLLLLLLWQHHRCALQGDPVPFHHPAPNQPRQSAASAVLPLALLLLQRLDRLWRHA